MRAIVGYQLGGHGLEFAAKQEVEKQGMYDVVAMMPERDLVGTEFLGRTIDDATAQTRTERAGRLALGNLFLDDRIRILLDDAVLDTQAAQISRKHVGGETRLLLIQIHCNQAKIHRRTLTQGHQCRQHGVGILAAGQADENGVAVLDHVVIGNRLADVAFKALFQTLKSLRFFH